MDRFDFEVMSSNLNENIIFRLFRLKMIFWAFLAITRLLISLQSSSDTC